MGFKLKKALIIPISAVAVCAAAVGVYLFNVNAVRFDYTEAFECAGEKSAEIRAQGGGVSYPFFANSAMLDEGGHSYSIPLGASESAVGIYERVNSPLRNWAAMTAQKYDDRLSLSYEVEESSSQLTVHFTGTAQTPQGDEPLEKLFVFDIENASAENPPTWTNHTEADNEFYPM